MRHHIHSFVVLLTFATAQAEDIPNLHPYPNHAGQVATYSTDAQPIPTDGAFFQSLGTNDRSCFSCHRAAQGWSVSPSELHQRFEATQGKDPIFRTNDGSVCDTNINTSTVAAKRAAYRLLLDRGLIRVSMQLPQNAEFTIAEIRNPYGCGTLNPVSVYRRVLPSTNLQFLSAVMWDGRESSPQTGTKKITYSTYEESLTADLRHQAADAIATHGQGDGTVTAEQLNEIVRFEKRMITAQTYDWRAGDLTKTEAHAGPERLGTETLNNFFIGINDSLNGNPRGTAFTPAIFDLFGGWLNPVTKGARASIARGEHIFNSKTFSIENVGGLNDALNQPSIQGTCGTCHDSPNVGNHSLSVPLNIGVAEGLDGLNVDYLPQFVLINNATGEVITTTDPGRALVTGLWKDIGKFKGPILRGLASRPPYFHNGAAQSVSEVVNFYDKRFNIGLTQQEKEDLIAFLNSL